MRYAKLIGAIGILVGLTLIGGSFIIRHEIEIGQKTIAHAEQGMGLGEDLLSISPPTKEMGKSLSDPMQHAMQEGKDKITLYTIVSKWMEIVGILLVIVATAFIIMSKKK